MSREPFSEEFDAALHCADKWTKAVVAPESAWIEPGQFASVRQESDATIRARNVACTPVVAVHCEKEWIGADGGETGV